MFKVTITHTTKNESFEPCVKVQFHENYLLKESSVQQTLKQVLKRDRFRQALFYLQTLSHRSFKACNHVVFPAVRALSQFVLA